MYLNKDKTNSLEIGGGVGQEFCMSPMLFNPYGEY